MPIIKILPHAALCPDGAQFESPAGTVLCQALLEHGIRIEHACDMSCACTPCHVIIRKHGCPARFGWTGPISRWKFPSTPSTMPAKSTDNKANAR